MKRKFHLHSDLVRKYLINPFQKWKGFKYFIKNIEKLSVKCYNLNMMYFIVRNFYNITENNYKDYNKTD